MNDNPHNQSKSIAVPAMGEQLRSRRKALKLTLKEVAERASLSVGFISQLERGMTTPSLSSLTNICRVLDMHAGQFFNFDAPSSLQSEEESDSLLFGVGKVSSDVVTYERLSAAFANNQLRATFIHEPAGFRSEPMKHEGEEIFYIVSGEITLEVGDMVSVLRQGDTAHFPSTQMHRTWNHTQRSTTIFHVCTMDVFDENHSIVNFSPNGLAITRHLSTK